MTFHCHALDEAVVDGQRTVTGYPRERSVVDMATRVLAVVVAPRSADAHDRGANATIDVVRWQGYASSRPAAPRDIVAPMTAPPPVVDLRGRVALVTGASRGLGRAVAVRLHELGAAVAVNTRDAARCEALAAELGANALAVPGDISADGVPDAIVACILARFDRLDIVVNNAAHAASTRFGDLGAAEFRAALEVNMVAPFLLTKAALPSMKAQQYGRVINISSLAGRMVSTLGGAHYTASKTGLLGLTRAMAKELGKFGITVNAICPGMIDTELTREHASDELLQQLAAGYPVPRLGTAREVADLIAFVASDAAGYITGASFDINGGDLMM